jgi:phage terminase large subunit
LLKGGRNFLIIRNVARTNKQSTFNEIWKGIERLGYTPVFRRNKSEMTVTCKNGYQAIFAGLDDPEKLKSITPKKGVITDIIIEEATETDYKAVKAIIKRLRGKTAPGIKKRITLLFNPIYRSHWIYKQYFEGRFGDGDTLYSDDDLLIVKTTYKDNFFLEDEDRKALEDEADRYFYEVYTLGNWGVLGHLIYTNYTIEDLSRKNFTHCRMKNGCDFGYTNDPSAVVKTYWDKPNKIIYVVGEVYEKKLTNDLLADKIKKLIGEEAVFCDCAEPKSVKELRMNGANAYKTHKGKDSILHGIQWTQQQKIVIDKTCQNFINEISVYHWLEDKTGVPVNIPVDSHDHHMNALRYAYEKEMVESMGQVYNSAM